MTTHSQEKRRFSRIPFHTHTLIVGPERSWESHLIDISLKGALVEKPEDWRGTHGDRFILEIELGNNADVIISMDVQAVHIEEGQIGCECLDIDVDSISHLKRLLELNLGNADLLERELSALWHGAEIH
ncbi:MAG: PilZ domain-containing protein [Gammaproteobacteria bacterium]